MNLPRRPAGPRRVVVPRTTRSNSAPPAPLGQALSLVCVRWRGAVACGPEKSVALRSMSALSLAHSAAAQRRRVPRARAQQPRAAAENGGASASAERYAARGVSASKEDVHAAIARLDKGLFPGAFCKVRVAPSSPALRQQQSKKHIPRQPSLTPAPLTPALTLASPPSDRARRAGRRPGVVRGDARGRGGNQEQPGVLLLAPNG